MEPANIRSTLLLRKFLCWQYHFSSFCCSHLKYDVGLLMMTLRIAVNYSVKHLAFENGEDAYLVYHVTKLQSAGVKAYFGYQLPAFTVLMLLVINKVFI
jgi:hypothetical protein